MQYLVNVNAGNDNNGNPRRGWIHYRTAKERSYYTNAPYSLFVDFYDDNYSGFKGAVPTKFHHLTDSGELSITPGQYRELLRMHDKAVTARAEKKGKRA